MANHKLATHHLSSALTANKQQNVKLARHHIGHALNALNDRTAGSGFAGSPKPPQAPAIEGDEPNDPMQQTGPKTPMPFGGTATNAAPVNSSPGNSTAGLGGLRARLKAFSAKK